MTAGWGETEVLMDVSSRRLARVLHRLLAEHGLLSFLSLLRAFSLNVIKRNQTRHACSSSRARTRISSPLRAGHHRFPSPPRTTGTRALLLTYPLEVELYMQIRAKLLQRTLGGGGNRGLL